MDRDSATYYDQKYRKAIHRINDKAIKCCPRLSRVQAWVKLDATQQNEIISNIINALMTTPERSKLECLEDAKLDNIIRMLLALREESAMAAFIVSELALHAPARKPAHPPKPAFHRLVSSKRTARDILRRQAIERSYIFKTRTVVTKV